MKTVVIAIFSDEETGNNKDSIFLPASFDYAIDLYYPCSLHSTEFSSSNCLAVCDV
jgi:hypothetical protein